MTAAPHIAAQAPTGQQFGAWTVINADATGKRALCSCSCGAIREVAVAALLDGISIGCGDCRKMAPRPRLAGGGR
jgi:hypothetical protein